MRHRAIPLFAPATKRRDDGSGCTDETKARGRDVLTSPVLNEGSAFSIEERKALRLTGLLPPDLNSLPTRVARAYAQYVRLPDALSKNIYVNALQDHNELLFYRLFSEHLREMIPIINDFTVGMRSRSITMSAGLREACTCPSIMAMRQRRLSQT